jgi:hypothetical protein
MNAPFLIDERVDPRLAFLARAAVRFELVEAGEISLNDAMDGLIDGLLCRCDRDVVERWQRDFPSRPKVAKPIKPREAAQSTYDALLYKLRIFGIKQLCEPNCCRRLEELSPQQMTDLIGTLTRVQPKYRVISNELISTIRKML